MKKNPDKAIGITLGMLLRGIRAMLSMSQAELAKDIGISKPTLARLESLTVTPSNSVIEKVWTYLSQKGFKIEMVEGQNEGLSLFIPSDELLSGVKRMMNADKRRKDIGTGKQESLKEMATTFDKEWFDMFYHHLKDSPAIAGNELSQHLEGSTTKMAKFIEDF